MSRGRPGFVALGLPVILAAFVLRVYRLAHQSLWYDEGSSVFLVGHGLPQITAGTAADIHPPLYYYLLHFWALAAGYGEFAVRFLSVAAGVLLVAFSLALGLRLLGLTPAVAGSWLVALSPLLVDYSQEARMYMLEAALALASSCAAIWMLQSENPGRSWPAAYVALSAAGLYTHYTYFPALLAQNLFALVWWLRQRRHLLIWLTCQAVTLLLFLPWLPAAARQLGGWPAISQPLTASELAARVIPLFGGGLQPHLSTPALPPAGVAMAAGCLALALLGALGARGCRGARGRLFLTLLSLAPIVAIYELNLRKPLYNPKFLLMAVPPYLLLAGAGLAQLRGWLRPLSVMAGVALVALAGYSLARYYTDPAFQRDDYRGLAALVKGLERPGDVAVLNAPGQEQIFLYYYAGALPVVGLPRDRPLNPGATAGQLEDLLARHRRVWLVLYGETGSDPSHFVEGWLNQHAFQAVNRWFGDVRLVLYGAPWMEAGEEGDLQVAFGPSIRLERYRQAPRRPESDDLLELRLRWRATAAPGASYKVFAHVIDAEENIWGQKDSEPLGGMAPTGSWRPGQVVEDRYGLLLLPGTPPGQYRIELGMYDRATGQRLPASGPGASGDRALLPPFQVGRAVPPPGPDAFEIEHPLRQRLGDLELLGYNLTLLGRDVDQSSFNTGDTLHLTLFWQAAAQPASDLRLGLSLGPVVAPDRGPLGGQGYPTSRWAVGEIVRSQHKLTVPRDPPAGRYLLHAEINGGDVRLAQVRVRAG